VSVQPGLAIETGVMQSAARKGEKNLLSVRNRTPEGARQVVLHELMHGVQGEEGFAQGGSSDEAKKLLAQALGRQPSRNEAYEAYLKLMGEAEARLVQERADLSKFERVRRPPWLDYDVPEALQTRGFQSPALLPPPR